MASIYLRGNIYWVKLGHPEGGRQVCFSLETPDQARASLLAQAAQARFDLRRPALRDMQLPNRILEFLGDSSAPNELPSTAPSAAPAPSPAVGETTPAQSRTPIMKALA